MLLSSSQQRLYIALERSKVNFDLKRPLRQVVELFGCFMTLNASSRRFIMFKAWFVESCLYRLARVKILRRDSLEDSDKVSKDLKRFAASNVVDHRWPLALKKRRLPANKLRQ